MSEVKTEEKVVQYIICRVCGYIETADKSEEACPACGFPKTVWTEFKPRKLNPTRKMLLDLHLHPIAVHFPIVGSVLSFVLPLLALIVPVSFGVRLMDMATLGCMVMPLLVLLGGISGAIGGKLRYKTMTAPLLKTKMYLSAVYFLLALAQAYLACTEGVQFGNAVYFIGLGIASFLVSAYLGKKGSHLFAGLFGPFVAG